MTTVGYKLRREIRDLFPAATTPAERAVALEIADTANENNRISLIEIDVLCARSGLGEDGLRKALQRLANRGLEFRMSRGKGKDGRDMYARNRQDINYRVPFPGEFETASGLILGGTTVPASACGKPVDKPP